MKYTIGEIAEIRDKMKTRLKPGRFEHTLGVAYTAASLGMIWEEDISKCLMAGMLHDCAKNMTEAELIQSCSDADIALTEEELASPQIIHSIYGAYLSETYYGITDGDVISAVRYHTTGRAAMSLLEKIIFIADFIEPLRNEAGCLKEARNLAYKDIDRCMCLILANTIEYLDRTGKAVESKTKEAAEYYSTVL